MPICNATATIAGVTDAYLSVTQYGIRAKMNLSRAKALTTATRTGSGTTKTPTFAAAHGLNVLDYILVGGGTLPDGYKTGLATTGLKYWWAQVTAVPSPPASNTPRAPAPPKPRPPIPQASSGRSGSRACGSGCGSRSPAARLPG